MVTRYALIVCALLACTTSASDERLLFADQLYDTEEYGWAYLEYERLIFSHPDTTALPLWKYRSGVCLMRQEQYKEAFSSLSSIGNADDKNIADSAGLQAALCELRLDKTGPAQKRLSTNKLDYAKIVDGYISFLNGHYTEAVDTLKAVTPRSPDSFSARALEKAITEAADFKKKHYVPALALSLVPGLGHLYSGNGGDAAMTAITIATGSIITGYYAYHESKYRAIAAGTVTGLLYAGGMYGAVMSVKIYNRNNVRKHREIAERIIFGQ